MKRKIDDMEIVWQTPANPPVRHDYIFCNGIRYVKPYHFEFISHVKNRWAGKTIVNLFTEEFKGRARDYYVSAVKAGRIQVDGHLVPISYVVQSSQKISHFLHRHEPPVMALDVEVLHKDPDVLTVCKPASVPVHPCGQYRKNTIVGILQAEHDLAPLFPIHRLDRLVSGLLILARNPSRADLFRQQKCLRDLHQVSLISFSMGGLMQMLPREIHGKVPQVGGLRKCFRGHFLVPLNNVEIESGLVKKQYIARVIGVFPENEQVVNANVDYNAREGKSSVEVGDGKTPLKGKSACTKFTRISTNGTQSIVLCEPITGRTHQIRVHLQYTGHPIANDMLYLSEAVVERSTEGLSADRAAAKLSLSVDQNPHVNHRDKTCDNQNEGPDGNSKEQFSIDPMCTHCPNLAPNGYDGPEEGLWLHCVKYSGPGWTYECPHPDWAILSQQHL